jgi:hypothetical protein
VRLNDPFELPSLEEIKEMDRQRCQVIESLEISGSGDSVKCQRCGIAVPIVGKLIKPKSNRIAILEKRVSVMIRYILQQYASAKVLITKLRANK